MLPPLESIPAAEVREPDLPMVAALQQAHDLLAALEADDTWDSVLAVGLAPALVNALPAAIAAARQAQSRWMVVRDRNKPRAQLDREQRGITLHRELVTACRWNLRDDPRTQMVLNAIAQGEGVADLVQDLLDLATLIERHASRFESDETFDAPTQAEAARSTASEIATGLAGDREGGSQHDAKLLRDRAFTHLDGIMDDIRAAGRYAFREFPQRAAVFTHDDQRRRRRAYRRRHNAQTAEVPVVPAAPEDTLTAPTPIVR